MKNISTLNVIVFLLFLSHPCFAQTNLIYGVTGCGYLNGVMQAGTIFTFDPSNNNEAVLYHFKNTLDANGPTDIILIGDSFLMGSTMYGGATGDGAIFVYDLVRDTETVIYSFLNAQNGVYNPSGGLTFVGTAVYGTCSNGGMYGKGALYKYDFSTNLLSVLKSFSDSTSAQPLKGLTLASNGLLYGTTFGGGGDLGTIYSYDIVNDTIKILYRFAGGNDGNNPETKLLQASNGLLYGFANQGGSNGAGVLFSYDINLNTEAIAHTFNTGTDGSTLTNTNLIEVNGYIYATAVAGGANAYGTLFRYRLSDGNFEVLHNFNNNPVSGGIYPEGSLFYASNGLIYGFTEYSGPNFYPGYLYSYDIVTDTLLLVHPFGGQNDGFCDGDMLQFPTITNSQSIKMSTVASLYPNPSAGNFNITLPSNDDYRVDIYNSFGEKIKSLNLKGRMANLDLRNEPAGLYFINISLASYTANLKAMIPG